MDIDDNQDRNINVGAVSLQLPVIKRKNKMKRIIIMALLLVCGMASANEIYRWNFTNDVNYDYNHQLIDVDTNGAGQAQLILQSDTIYHTLPSDYTASNTVRENVSYGSPVSLQLTKYENVDLDMVYQPKATFISRPFFSNLGFNYMQFKGANYDFLPSSADPNMVALYRMNSDGWIDAVTGQNGVTNGNPQFTTDSKAGGGAGLFDSGSYLAMYNRLVTHNKSQLTVACWIKVFTYNPWGEIVGSYYNNNQYWALKQWRPENNGFGFIVKNGSTGYVAINLDLNKWYFMVGVYDKDDAIQSTRLYVNGVSVDTPVEEVDDMHNNTFAPTDTRIAKDANCIVDEVAIWDRALSADEVADIYQGYKDTFPLRFQVRSSGTMAGLANSVFSGPGGTNSTYFKPLQKLESVPGSFNVAEPYAQYKVTMYSSTNQLETPSLLAAGLFNEGRAGVDQFYGDFVAGTVDSNLAISAVSGDQSFLGLNRSQDGGYFTNGVYVSKIFDAGDSVYWSFLGWKYKAEKLDPLSTSIPGLIGLYHCDNLWSDDSGEGNHPTTSSSFTSLAKIGRASAYFSGSDPVDIPAISGIQSIEFWINNSNPDDEIIRFTTNKLVVISSGHIKALGFGTDAPDIYLNEIPSKTMLYPGWNHVALIWSSPITSAGVVIGDGMHGYMDELAFYDRKLHTGEIRAHYYNGAPNVAGKVKFQGRASDDPAFDGVIFVGGDEGDPSSYLVSPGNTKAGEGRYFQYRAIFEGAGDATPGIKSVEILYPGTSLVSEVVGDFEDGEFVDNETTWWGERIPLRNNVDLGPANIKHDSYLKPLYALWHLDEPLWGVTHEVVGDVFVTPDNGASASSESRIGPGCGFFDGIGGRILFSADLFDTREISVAMWVKSSSTTRAPLMSSYQNNLNTYFTLEFNSDGANLSVGHAAFTLKNGDGSEIARVSTWNDDLNDGKWHNLVGIRNRGELAIYVDGELSGVAQSAAAQFADIAGNNPVLAYGGQLDSYFEGFIDEVAIFSWPLSLAEISEIAGGGAVTRDVGVFEGPIAEAADSTIWEDLNWLQTGRYGIPVLDDADSLTALWHLDDAAGSGTVADSSGNGNDGATFNGVIQGDNGKFDTGVSLDGVNDRVVFSGVSGFDSAKFTASVWINLDRDKIASATVLDASDGSGGYVISTDASGYPIFWMGTTSGSETLRGLTAIRSGVWTHLAVSYDGTDIRLYVDGNIVGKKALANPRYYNGDVSLGVNVGGAEFLAGNIDDVAVFSKALSYMEINDIYRSGIASAKVRARSWSPDPRGAYVGPSGSNDTYFVDAYNSTLRGAVVFGKYMQYRIELSTEDGRYPPDLYGISGKFSAYPLSGPPVAPLEFAGADFVGNLVALRDDTTLPGPRSEVHYQVSGDTGADPRWFYYDIADSNNTHWAEVDSLGLPQYRFQSSLRSTVSSKLRELRQSYYSKSNGLFRFRALLGSDGEFNTHLNWVELEASSGRIVVTSPNGQEVGTNAWLIGSPYDITWEYSGDVTGTVQLDYSTDGGNNWIMITNGISADAGIYNWRTPEVQSSRCLIRINHESDNTIYDQSDSEFELVLQFYMVVPNGGEKWYIGETNTIVFDSPASLASVYLAFSGDGNWANPISIVDNYPAPAGTRSNTYAWVSATDDPGLISETAKIRASLFGGLYADDSDESFIMAGAAFYAPLGASKVNKGTTFELQWEAAACGSNVTIEIQTQVGGAWSLIESNVINVTGYNTYNWSVTNQPSENTRIRITSEEDPRAIGISDTFTISALVVKSPDGDPDPAHSERWLNGTRHHITWVSAGVDAFVNISCSINGINGPWTVIREGFPNDNAEGVTNVFDWLVPDTPSGVSMIKVEDATRPAELFDVSDFTFHIAGVALTWPNGGEEWPLHKNDVISWVQDAVGNSAYVDFSYDGGITYTNIVGPGMWIPLLPGVANPYAPILPTVRGMTRIRAIKDSSTPFSNIVDTADDYFTVAGILVEQPAAGDRLGVENTFPVVFVAAGTHAPGFQADVYYSGDNGVTWDIDKVKENYVFSEDFPGRNSFNWLVERTREPTEQARLKIVAGSMTVTSEVFSVKGVRFNSPATGEVVPVGNKLIKWSTAGFPADATAEIYLSYNASDPNSYTNLLGTGFLVGSLELPWVVPASIEPTTNAALKIVIIGSSEAEDIGYATVSAPFIIQNLKVFDPGAGESLVQGQPYTIRWKAAEAGSSLDIYYSSDGGTNYDAVAIAQAVPLSDGFNSYAWNVEMDRLPSDGARIKLISNTGFETESDLFVMNGIQLLRPRSSDIYVAANGATNMIVWQAGGDNGPYRLDYSVNGGAWTNFASGISGASYNWAGASIPLAAVSSTVQIRISGVNYTNVSPLFLIVDEATVLVSAPVAGDYWHIGDTYRVKWSKGGDMPNNFSVFVSYAPYTATQQINGITIDYDVSDNAFWFNWTVPDIPTQAKFFVKHNDNVTFPDVWAYSGEFNMVGTFELLSPNGGELLFASRPTPIVWRTRGKIPQVDVYYSSVPPYDAASWTKLNTLPIENAYDDDDADGVLNWVQSAWAPPMPDFSINPNVKFRVQEHQYVNGFDSGIDGPFDDSAAAFTIRYYRVFWQVYDEKTTNALDNLAVVDSSGWSASSLSAIPPSVIYNDYRWGTWNTEWYRDKFFDKVVLNWSSEINGNPAVWTQMVYMAISEKEPEVKVMANFTYKIEETNFVISAWVERGGIVLENPSVCRVFVYEENGALLTSSSMPLSNISALENGVFWFTWNAAALDRNDVYFARVEVDYSGKTYSSGVMFELTVSAGEEIVEAINASLSSVQSNLTSEIRTVGGVLGDFRSEAMQSLTNIEDKIDVVSTNMVSLTNSAAINRGLLTNQVSVTGSFTNLTDAVDRLEADAISTRAHILTRPETIVYGSTNSIVYKTRGGYAAGTVVLKVLNSSGTTIRTVNMTEISAGMGLYEASILANWGGYGYYSLECSDPQASDRTGCKLVEYDLQVIPAMMQGLVTNMAGLVVQMHNVDGSVSNMYEVIGDLTNLQMVASNVVDMADAFGTLSSNVFDLIDVTDNLETNIDKLVGSIDNLDLSILSTNVQELSLSVSNMVDQLGTVDFVGMESNMIEVLDLVGSLSDLNDLTNALADFQDSMGTNLVNLSSNMTEIANSLQNVDFADMYGYITNIEAAVTGGITSGYADVSESISNAIEKIEALRGEMIPMVTNVSDIAAQFTGLSMSDMYDTVTNVEAMVGGMGDLSQVGVDVSNAVATLEGMTNLTGVSDSVDALLAQMQGVDLAAMGSDVSNIMIDVQHSLSTLGNLDTVMSSVSNSVASLDGVDLAGMSGNLTNILSRLDVLDVPDLKDDLTNLVAIVGGLGDLAVLQDNVSNIVDELNGITGLADVSTNVLLMKAKLDSFGEWPTNFSAVIDGLRDVDFNAMSGNLTNVLGLVRNIDTATLQSDISFISNQLALVDLIQMSFDITNILEQVGSLDSGVMSEAVTALTNAMDGVNFADWGSGITNIETMVAALDSDAILSAVTQLTNAMAGVDFAVLGNISNILDAVGGLGDASLDIMESNLVTVLTAVDGMTNVSDLVDFMQGVDLGQMSTDLSNVLVTVQGLGDVDGLSSNITTLVGKMDVIDGLAAVDFGALPRLEASLGTAVVGDVLQNIQHSLDAITGLDSSISQISRDSAKAASNSQSARTKADAASSAAKKVMKALEAGDVEGTRKALKRMRAELAAAQASIDEIPKGGIVRDVYDEMQQMAVSMKSFAESKGFAWLTTMQEIPGASGGEGGGDLEGTDKKAINTLNSNMQDMKVSMDFMKKLLDEMRYEPVVQDSLIGIE